MIKRIERFVIFPGKKLGTSWFHPRACLLPDGSVLMTLQTITGSDVFGPVHWTTSTDGGHTWSEPKPIPSLGRIELDGGLVEGVCDVVPEYHPPTDTVLAMGHNVYYKDETLTQPSKDRHPVYAVRDASGRWSDRRRLLWDDPRATAMHSCGCGQRVTLENGDILVPLSFAPLGRTDRSVGTVRCVFDGEKLHIVEAGNELRRSVKRGLLEPSLVRFRDRFYLTIRAEDERGYWSVSDDGLHWAEPKPWCWNNDEPLTMSTTQQHWLARDDEELYLVYTRKADHNVNVMRWRAPLFIARVDVDTMRLLRDTELEVFPLRGDGINDPDHVARMGNFHVTPISSTEAWVTVGETLPADGWAGDTLLAKVFF